MLPVLPESLGWLGWLGWNPKGSLAVAGLLGWLPGSSDTILAGERPQCTKHIPVEPIAAFLHLGPARVAALHWGNSSSSILCYQCRCGGGHRTKTLDQQKACGGTFYTTFYFCF